MPISHEDREWFKQTVDDALKRRDEHCKNEIAKALESHRKDAISHNPVKAIITGSALVGIVEFFRSLLKH